MTSELIARPAPPTLGQRPAATVLPGFCPAAIEAVARIPLVTDPGLLMIRHDIGRDRFDTIRLATLLHRIAPWATHVSVGRRPP